MDSDSSTEIECEERPMASRRGVKVGTKRGKYKQRGGEEKARILAIADGGGDWRAAANANGVNTSTAYGWICKMEESPKRRGGSRRRKIEEAHVEKMLAYLEENPQLTLKEIASKLRADTGISVSTTAVHKHLHGRLYTCKKVRPEPSAMNSEENRRKRAAYVADVMAAIGQGKKVIYIDECNANLFLRRSNGRSRKGTRCSIKTPTSKGRNIHIVGGISQTGLVYWERRRGSYKKEACNAWMRELLRRVQEPMDRVVVVCDNAPVHAGLETVFEEEEFRGATLLRTGPYSAPLNPIEECWSVLKAEMKRRLAAEMLRLVYTPPPEGLTQTEHHLRHLEGIIDASVPLVTPMLCLSTFNHVQRHFAACLALHDLAMGDNVM